MLLPFALTSWRIGGGHCASPCCFVCLKNRAVEPVDGVVPVKKKLGAASCFSGKKWLNAGAESGGFWVWEQACCGVAFGVDIFNTRPVINQFVQ